MIPSSSSGRKQIIVSGTGFELCASLPAISAVADGFSATVAFDASGRLEPTQTVGINRLVQAGVEIANTQPLVLELMGDHAHPKAGEIYGFLFGGA